MRAIALIGLLAMLPDVIECQQRHRWVRVVDNATAVTSVDTATMSFEDAAWIGWIRTEYVRPAKTMSGKTFQSSMSRTAHDCTRRRTRVFTILLYSKNGDVVEHFDSENPAWSSVVPETVGETALDALCTLTEYLVYLETYTFQQRSMDSIRRVACAEKNDADVASRCWSLRTPAKESTEQRVKRAQTKAALDLLLGLSPMDPPVWPRSIPRE